MSAEEDRDIDDALDRLRTLPAFQLAVLAPLRAEFLRHLDILSDCSREELDSIRGVVAFIAGWYEDLSGEPIVAPRDAV